MVSFHLDKNSADTYCEQIRAQIILHLLSSNIKDGEKLPTIRQTAHILGISTDTVFKIYRRLQADNILRIRRGSGVFVRCTSKETWLRSRALTNLIADTLRKAEFCFGVQPRAFANLIYSYISKAGSASDTYLVVNDDETREIDARTLRLHFRCQFVPVDVASFAEPSPPTRRLIRSARGWITTRYHIQRLGRLMTRTLPPLIEIKRDPQFVGDVCNAAANQRVLVVFQCQVSCDHFREIVFRRLYPGIVNNLSFAAMENQTVHDKVNEIDLIFASPLCCESVRNMAPSRATVEEIKGWISSDSLENIRSLLLCPPKAVPAPTR